MLNKDIQQIRMNVLEVLIESCRDNPSTMYEQVQKYLQIMKDSLEQSKEFYEAEYKR